MPTILATRREIPRFHIGKGWICHQLRSPDKTINKTIFDSIFAWIFRTPKWVCFFATDCWCHHQKWQTYFDYQYLVYAYLWWRIKKPFRCSLLNIYVNSAVCEIVLSLRKKHAEIRLICALNATALSMEAIYTTSTFNHYTLVELNKQRNSRVAVGVRSVWFLSSR